MEQTLNDKRLRLVNQSVQLENNGHEDIGKQLFLAGQQDFCDQKKLSGKLNHLIYFLVFSLDIRPLRERMEKTGKGTE